MDDRPHLKDWLAACIDSGVTALLGIAETKPGVFIFGAADFSLRSGFVEGTAQMWEVSFHSCDSSPSTRHIANLSYTGLPNGLLRWSDDAVLFADTTEGQIIKFNTTTGLANRIIQDQTMLPLPTFPIGINGIKHLSREDAPTFTIQTPRLGCYAVCPSTLKRPIPQARSRSLQPEFLGTIFSMLPDGTALVAGSAVNSIIKVTLMVKIPH